MLTTSTNLVFFWHRRCWQRRSTWFILAQKMLTTCARRRPSASTLSASPVPEEDQVLRRCQHLMCQKKTKLFDIVSISCAIYVIHLVFMIRIYTRARNKLYFKSNLNISRKCDLNWQTYQNRNKTRTSLFPLEYAKN
jgi:hypothetical protein